LSGFLIGSSVLQKWNRPEYDFAHYVIDRFCRIFSGYLPALVFVAAVDATLFALPGYPYADTSSVGTWLGNLVMLQEYPVFQILKRLGMGGWFIEAYGSGRPFWTVAIEWWIYLFFGYLAFFVLRRRRFRPVDGLILAFFGVIPAYNAMGGVGQCLSFVWALGAAVAYAQHRLAARGGLSALIGRVAAGRGALALILVSLALMGGRVMAVGVKVYDLQFAIFTGGVLFGLFFLLGARPFTPPRWVRTAIDRLSDYSYSLYLTHYTVLIFFAVHWPSAEKHDPMRFATLVVAANLIAIFFWFLFERHYHALARRAKQMLDRRRPVADQAAA
jgi:peptidoglycan/LPS O-acetylase OafA/YrhL